MASWCGAVWRPTFTTTAKLRLPDKVDEERKLITAGDGQITFAQAAKIYMERVNHDPGTGANH
jgi:hypothetical protein